MNPFIFTHAPKQNSPQGFYRYPQSRRESSIPPEQHFLKIFFPEEKGEGENHGVENITTINKGIGYKI